MGEIVVPFPRIPAVTIKTYTKGANNTEKHEDMAITTITMTIR
jgi:hypothetical protein